jgi:hypothetical protein
MSGYKRAMIRISQEEYRKLHHADMQRRFSDSRKKEKNSIQETDLKNQKRLAKLEQQQAQFDRMIDILAADIGVIEANTRIDSLGQQEEFLNEISSHMEGIWDNEQTLAGIQQIFDQRLEQESHIRQLHMQRMDEFIRSQQDSHASNQEMAEDWFSNARSIGLFIRDQFEHDRFAPGQFERISRELNMAQRNMNHGLYEAAISSSQTAYLHFLDLRLELDQKVFDWQTLFDTTWKAARSLYDGVRESATCNALDLEGQELPILLDLNYWSKGQYASLLERIQAITSHLKMENATISSAQLRDLMLHDLPDLKNEFDSLVFQARYSALNSQLRVNIADLAVHALERQGFVSENYGYSKNDQRSRYITQMVNIEGSRVTIQVEPVDDLEFTNYICLETQDASPKFMPEIRKRSQLILQSLQKWGLQIGQIQTSPRISDAPVNFDLPVTVQENPRKYQPFEKVALEYGRTSQTNP